MISAARRVFRRIFPRRQHPILDAEPIQLDRDPKFAEAYRSVVRVELGDPTCEDAFVKERYVEGQRWRAVLGHFISDCNARYLLDVGGGNGAIELALTAEERWRVISVDSAWNDTVRVLRHATQAALRRVIADASHLPFRTNTFDAVTCLETVEHLSDARSAASEITKVTKRGGLLLLTTPPGGGLHYGGIHTSVFQGLCFFLRSSNEQSLRDEGFVSRIISSIGFTVPRSSFSASLGDSIVLRS
jgi:SAM-dependent methyltransferase